MKVKSIKGNRKLIKGHVYETDFFNNDQNQTSNNYRYSYKRISIKDRGYYNVDDFTQTDGQPLPKILYDIQVKKEPTKISDLKKGDVLVCLSDQRFKYLIKGGKYRISDIRITNPSSTWGAGDIRLEGYNRWLMWSTWNFRKLSLQESRDLALSQIFDKEENFSVEFKRKFELKSDKDVVLIETLAKSILDKNRHELNVIDWGIEKSGGNFKLTQEDFKHLMDKPLKEIIQMFDNLSEE
jgi:hypothetical protein